MKKKWMLPAKKLKLKVVTTGGRDPVAAGKRLQKIRARKESGITGEKPTSDFYHRLILLKKESKLRKNENLVNDKHAVAQLLGISNFKNSTKARAVYLLRTWGGYDVLSGAQRDAIKVIRDGKSWKETGVSKYVLNYAMDALVLAGAIKIKFQKIKGGNVSKKVIWKDNALLDQIYKKRKMIFKK